MLCLPIVWVTRPKRLVEVTLTWSEESIDRESILIDGRIPNTLLYTLCNFWAIAIQNSVAKIFEVLTYEQTYVRVNKLLLPYRHNFVKKKSTVSNFVHFTGMTLSRKYRGRRHLFGFLQVFLKLFLLAKALCKGPYTHSFQLFCFKKLYHLIIFYAITGHSLIFRNRRKALSLDPLSEYATDSCWTTTGLKIFKERKKKKKVPDILFSYN